MKILWMTWKDLSHPLAGGAEIVNEELAKRLAKDGHEVIFLVSGFPHAATTLTRDGYTIIRLGGRFSVYWRAYKYYKKNLVGWADLVIDEVNTIPFFAKFYVKEKNILFVHQLCREICFYQMFFPLNVIGYILEPIYLFLLNDRQVITVSNSTKQDLIGYGYNRERITIISEGIQHAPLVTLLGVDKFKEPTLLSIGAVRPMKRTVDIVRAFNNARNVVPTLRLIIAGDMNDPYGDKVMKEMSKSPHQEHIQILGRVDQNKKEELLKKSHLLAVTSIREGWGLTVTEANACGTPALVYNVPGLRDSVRDEETGLVSKKNTPQSLSEAITSLLHDTQKYDRLKQKAWEWSKEINFERSYGEFRIILQK